MARHAKLQAAIANRDARRKALAEKTAASSGLSVDDIRIDLISWVLLEIDAQKTRMLHGHVGSADVWQRIADKLASIIPPPPQELKVAYVFRCTDCKKETANDPEPATPPAPAPVPQPVGAPAPPAENVVPLHAVPAPSPPPVSPPPSPKPKRPEYVKGAKPADLPRLGGLEIDH